MKQGGFNLSKWKTNSPHMQQNIDEMKDSSNRTDEIPRGKAMKKSNYWVFTE